MSHRVRWWIVAVVGTGVVAAEWLRDPTPVWVVVAWLTCLAAGVALRPFARAAAGPAVWRRRGLAVALAALAITLALTQWHLAAIETRWSDVRDAQVADAAAALGRALAAARRRVERLAEAGAQVSGADRTAAFARLAAALPAGGPEMGVALLDPGDVPWAWAGRHRLGPHAAGDSLGERTTGYYVILEARRHSPDGRTAVASLLLWAHPAVPDRARSLADRFHHRHDIALTVGPAPAHQLEPVPPEQGAARELALARGSRVVAGLLLLVLVFTLSLAARPLEWYAVLPLFPWLAMRAPIGRAPIGPALGLQPLFSPATFFRPLLGPLSGSAGALALTGTLLTMLGVWLWRRRVRRTWYGMLAGAGLLYAAPYLIRSLGRGITPPANGVSIRLWLTWQLALVVSVTALVVPTAALLRGHPPQSRASAFGRGTFSVLGAAIALAAAVLGVLVWSPHGAWPDWYPFLWTLALLLIALPAPRWAAISGIAVAAGTSAALVTWSAELSGKLDVAQHDIAGLGAVPDPLAALLLDRFGDQLRRAPPPAGASAMYALWNGSALSERGYPATLGLWSPLGEPYGTLPLDSLDLPPSLLSALVRELPPDTSQRVVPLLRAPGMHYVLLARVSPDTVITVAVGPRSALVAPGRVGRLLDPHRQGVPLYRLALAPPMGTAAAPVRLHWQRDGWQLRGDQTIALPGGDRTVHAVLDLRGPWPIFIRAGLVVVLDAAILALLWFAAEYVAGARLPALRWSSWRRSFRLRLAATLGAFFVLPAVGFTIWGLARLKDEAERGRDLLVAQTLRDAVAAGGDALRAAGAPPVDRLRELSRRIDADLALYEGGRLTATSVDVLQDLGVIGQMLDPTAFKALALHGELETTLGGAMPARAERVGYRLVEPGRPREAAVLATPQLGDELWRGPRELDLAFGLLLVTILGVAAALVGARVASRALSRPVAELRRAAIALGQGDAPPPHDLRPPAEFEPVFAAFDRMASDIQASHRAQRILAWGEMARQVAHEIKNPLTPLRLGIQHLRRVHRDRRADFDRVFDETADRILGEIDRLDTIARAFSRFGAPADSRQPVGEIDLAAVAGEVVQLYRLAEESRCEVRLVSEAPAWGAARPDEMKEVIVNLLENARNAAAQVVTITAGPEFLQVTDDGHGIAPELLPRIFEPRFSTTTSGSGLGLAIVRRLVEDWGGRIEVTSEVGCGTTVTIRLAAAAPPPTAPPAA